VRGAHAPIPAGLSSRRRDGSVGVLERCGEGGASELAPLVGVQDLGLAMVSRGRPPRLSPGAWAAADCRRRQGDLATNGPLTSGTSTSERLSRGSGQTLFDAQLGGSPQQARQP
jgi:hypothetical protein